MANTSVRTVRLLSLLQNHRYWSGTDLAERLEVSARTLRRDVERLRELGYPVESRRGVDGGYELAAGAALPPLVLEDEEAVAIVVGLQTAAQSAVEGVAESSVRALAKVVPVLPPRLRRRAEALGAMTVPGAWSDDTATVDADILTTLAQAARDNERVEFDYTDRANAPTHRLVDPHRLVVLGRRWYLVAYDMVRHDWRSFRVDRLGSPARTGVRFPPREVPGGDAVAFVRRTSGPPAVRQTVEAIVRAPSGTVQTRIGRWATVEPIDEGTSRVTMTVESLDWSMFALGTLGAEFTVIGPPELSEQLEAWAARFRRAVSASELARPADGGAPTPHLQRRRRAGDL